MFRTKHLASSIDSLLMQGALNPLHERGSHPIPAFQDGVGLLAYLASCQGQQLVQRQHQAFSAVEIRCITPFGVCQFGSLGQIQPN